MNTLVTHDAGAAPTVTSSQYEERESFIQKRCLQSTNSQAAPCGPTATEHEASSP
jgi:hypothetical protein